MEKTITSRVLYRGRAVTFRTDEVELPNGRRTTRDVVEHPGAVAIVPVLPDGRIVLVRQYRYAARRDLLEIPAGTLESGEMPLDCARRELREETGYDAEMFEELLRCYVAPGYSDELIHIFVARDLSESHGEMEYDEDIEVELHEPDEAIDMIKRNVIEDSKTINGILAIRYLLAT